MGTEGWNIGYRIWDIGYRAEIKMKIRFKMKRRLLDLQRGGLIEAALPVIQAAF